MSPSKFKFCFLFCLLLTLIACTNQTGDNVIRREAQTPSNSSAPVRSEAAPVIVVPPDGYTVDNGRNGLILNGSGESGEKLIGIRVQTALGTAGALDSLIDEYMSDLPSGWNGLIIDETIGTLSGRATGYALQESGETSVSGRAIAVSDGSHDYLVFTIMHQDDWIDSGLGEFDTFTRNIEFDSIPVASESAPRVPQNSPESETESPDLLEIPPFSGQSADGYACVGGFDTSLICILPSGEIKHFTSANSNLEVDSVYDLHACPDGRILQVDVRGFKLFDGEDFVIIQKPPNEGQVDHIRCGPNLEIWTANFNGIHVHRGAGWETFAVEQIFKDADTLINALQIAPDGTAWTVSFNEVAFLTPNSTEWVSFSEGDGFSQKEFFESLMIDDDGTPFVSHTDGLVWYDDSQWLQLESEEYWAASQLALAPDGQIYITTFSDGVAVSDRRSFTYLTMVDGLTTNKNDEIQIDGRGRIWLNHEFGLDVFDGSNWFSLRMDNTLLPFNDYLTLVVVGDGPELPQMKQEESGSVIGTFVSPSGQPMAFAAVEMCLSGYVTAFGIQDRPCEDQEGAFVTETDANGRFQINEVPSAWYDFFYFVEENDAWQSLYDLDTTFLDRNILIESRETLDLGVVNALPEDE